MQLAGNSQWQARVDLAPGVYEYKFRLSDRDWALDPANPRTRCRDGSRNSVVVVDGTEEPVLHAPSPRFVYREDDGRVCVRAGLRRGAGSDLSISWSEGAGHRQHAMTVVAVEAEHTMFETYLPGCARSLEYRFVYASAGGPVATRTFRSEVAALTQDAPAWWRDAVVYSIFVDRFRRGGSQGQWDEPAAWNREHRAGGDLSGIAEALPYLRDLGVTALHLTPICEAPSPHRYDCVEPRTVADSLGGEDAFRALLDEAHEHGVRVIVDVTVTHVDREFFAFRDVAERGPESPYWDWFFVYSHPFAEGERPGYRHYQKGQWREPLLNLNTPAVRDYLVDTFEYWMDMGADGVRVDAAADVPPALLRRIKSRVRRLNREAVVFGEVIPGNSHRWTGDTLHAATDFAFSHALRDWLCGETGAEELEHVRRQRQIERGGPSWTSMAFTSTHDQSRLLSATGDPRLMRLGQLATLLRAGIPVLYYGDEVGLRSDVATCEFEDAWPDRQCMEWSPGSWDTETLGFVRAVLAVRARYPALRNGTEQSMPMANQGTDVFAFRRASGSHVVDVLMNRGGAPCTVELGVEPAALVIGAPGVKLSGSSVTLDGHGWAVLDRTARWDPVLARENAAICREAQRNQLTECPAEPARIYVTVTEACNLRCAHCITGAPTLTAGRRARTMQPWLIEALKPTFAAADYFGFVHGGESLTTPMFDEVLRGIQAARVHRSGRYGVHLATNAMLLDGERARSLVDLGLSSVMVSLDGATAATNDRVRVGGRFQRILANLRGLVELREQRALDLRIGVSTVLGVTNVDEAGALAALVRDLGVDWLKLEETFPATSFAEADALRVGDERLMEAVGAVRGELAGTPVVFVNHLNPPSGCVCASPSPALAQFRKADDYANRFGYCSCRAPWEQACIDPDGQVRQVDYGHPALGSLLHAPMLTLWNSETAQQVRQSTLV